MVEKKKVKLVKVESNSDPQKVLEKLIAALEDQGFNITRKEKDKL